ncbi:MAG: hypothetical protein AAFW47_01380 [Pseudomonadota bacterium]
MTMLVIYSLLLIALAYILGCILGCFARSTLFADAGPKYVADTSKTPAVAAAAATAVAGGAALKGATVAPPAPPKKVEPAIASPYRFNAVKTSSDVTLSGSMPSLGVRDKIVATAGALGAVVDKTTLNRGQPDGFEGAAAFAVGQLDRFSTGQASIVDRAITIDGEPKDLESYNLAKTAANNGPVGYSVDLRAKAPEAPELSEMSEPDVQGQAPSVQNKPVETKTAAKTAPKGDLVDIDIPSDMADAAAKADAAGQRPKVLAAARGGNADDLKRIKGVGPKNEKAMNALGVYHFDQIASWSPDEASWMGTYMAFPGRIEREDWIPQAKRLAAGEETEFSKRVDGGAVPTSKATAKSASAPRKTKSPATKTGGRDATSKGAVTAAAISAASVDMTISADKTAAAEKADGVGTRPKVLAAPLGGKKDNLQRVRGIGPKNERALYDLGIYHFAQIGAWTAPQARWVGSFMAFPGRIEREDWIAQAKLLAKGKETEFSKRVDKGQVATSKSKKT